MPKTTSPTLADLGQGIQNTLGSIFGMGNQSGIQEAQSKIPEAPDLQGEVGPAREEAVTATREAEDALLAAEQADKREADQVGEEARRDTERLTGDVEQVREDLDRDQNDVNRSIGRVEEQLDQLPGQAGEAFREAQDTFQQASEGAISGTQEDRADALGDVYQGMGRAMQAAVQGIQGNVDSQVSQIQSNPSLSPAQKQQMVTQARLGGAMSMGPAIGATQLQFNTLAANTAVSFGQILGQQRTATMTGTGQIATAGAAAETQAFATAAQMGGQMAALRSSSANAFAASQSQLLAVRSQAEMSGNQLALALLPEQSTPYVDHVGSATLNMQTMADLIKSDFAMQLGAAGLDIQALAAKAQEGGWFGQLLGLAGAFIG